MSNYDPELQTHFRLWLDGEEVPFPEGSARFVQGSIEPIDEAVYARRTVNGNLRVQADPAFRKFRLTVSCTDSMLPALFCIDPTAVATVWSPVVVRERGTTPSRTPVSGSLVAEDDWIEYRPILTGYLTSIPSLSEPEWQSDASWSMVFEESAVPTVYFVTLSDAPLATVAPGATVSFNVGVLAATNTGLPIAYARVAGSLPPGTSLNASTGMITGTPTTAGLYTFTIRATAGGQTGEQTYSILVNAAAEPRVSFSAVTQQDYEAGVSFGLNLATSVAVENSSAVPVFFVIGGALPPGLSLSTSGAVFGTPTGYGPFSAQVRAIIATGEFAVQTIAFYAAEPTIVSNGVALQNYTVGTAYSLDLAALVDVANTTDDPTFAADVGSFPAGLSMNGAGVISGTPTGYGAYAFSARATLPTGQWTEVTVAFFAQMPDGNLDAIFSGGTSRAWTDDSGVSMVAEDLLASGSFVVTTAGWANLTGCATGGGGGSINNNSGASCGGGGAGQFIDTRVWLAAGTYTVSIGATSAPGTAGNSTTITGPAGFSITLLGGGAGAGAYGPGGAGASGGGGSWNSGSRPGGAATSIETGTAGGNGHTVSTGSGGGGGFASPGEDGNTTRGGAGGGGVRKKLWTWLNFCGGGGGGGNSVSTIFSVGRNGGGNGGTSGTSGGAATANTGSGGGGGGHRTNGTAVLVGGSGGSGRLIVWGRATS